MIGMKEAVKKYFQGNGNVFTVVDVGSFDFNGSYRDIFAGFNYIGVDIQKGKNVDVVMESEYDTGLPESYADIVISGQCLEHCRNPFKLVGEMFRICKPGGTCIVCAPFVHGIHLHPIDCWRFLPDGFKCLFEDAGFKTVDVYLHVKDCFGIAIK
jgi:SAM-dependent methyltransferase